jgi:hypothetical protein
MKARVGDSIMIESDKAGSPPRTGRILEVLVEAWGTRYRVRWDDGHESTIHPIAGTARVRHQGRADKGWETLAPAS